MLRSPAVLVSVGFLALQWLVLGVAPPAAADLAAYGAMIAAPALAAVACLWRRRSESLPALRLGWACAAAHLLLWCLGGLGNLWWEWGEGQMAVLNRCILLIFHLASMPLLFLLARPGLEADPPWARGLDALQSVMLVLAYFWLTWGSLAPANGPDAPGVSVQLWLLDAQNLYLALGLWVRWHATAQASERALYGTLALHMAIYGVIASLNNHVTTWYPDAVTPAWSSVVTAAFMLMLPLAWPGGWPSAAPARWPSRHREHLVHSASPLILSSTLLVLSLLLIRVDYAWGVVGVLVATLSSGLRGALAQTQQRLQGDTLRQQHSSLERIAWTDALTGIPNRHYLAHALRAWEAPDRRQPPPERVLMMIDIDHFKALNDRQGHPYGDACLRSVALALRQTLNRPGDVLVRFGGEEFLALVPEMDRRHAPRLAERLRAAVEALGLQHDGASSGRVTVSVGWASQPGSRALDFDTLVAQADLALYEAKCAGRNRVAGGATAAG